MKKTLLFAAAMMGLAAVSQAASQNFTAAGCGLGSMLFHNNTGKAQLVLAATTNGIFGNQTFGISSETLGCTSNGVVMNDKQVEVYAAVNFQKLSQEMAQGGGEYLSGLSRLMGCKDKATKEAFFKLAQSRYEKILPSDITDSVAMVRNLRAQMAADPVLRTL